MNALRSLAESSDIFYKRRDDLNNCSIAVIPLPDSLVFGGYLIMTWYKERGKVSDALIVCDGSRQPLKEYIALAIIDGYKKRRKNEVEKV